MPKRPSDDGRVGRKRHRRRLYLVTNDGAAIYGIRKFDLPSDPPSSADDDGHATAQRLPRALVRLEASSSRFFAAIGNNKIMVMDTVQCERIVPVFDVRTRCVVLVPRDGPRPTWPMYLPVGEKLAALDDDSSELLRPCLWGWGSQDMLPNPPFDLEDITAHCAHPDGRTVFISSKAATFSLDVASRGAAWRRHGEWKLPFAGRAHYDPRLDAWVGLSGDSSDTLGHLCSCDVVPTDPSINTESPPAWELSKEKLFREDPAEQHVGASLVYVGVARFCLVQYFSVAEDDAAGSSASDEPEAEEVMPPSSPRYRLRLTAFSLLYDKKGDLRSETPVTPRRARCYQLPAPSEIHELRDPVAFWL